MGYPFCESGNRRQTEALDHMKIPLCALSISGFIHVTRQGTKLLFDLGIWKVSVPPRTLNP
ncbi:MAG: hypothetical protein C4576_14775 [Desulfobacteraceae bacterium]|nr:MAG: hypothetical protein C4576_14775 [Desulfobacteraceae bacterium]